MRNFAALIIFLPQNRDAAEVHAPTTGEIERQLKQLVAKFGEKKVREALGSAGYEMQMERLAMRGKCDPPNSSRQISGPTGGVTDLGTRRQSRQ